MTVAINFYENLLLQRLLCLSFPSNFQIHPIASPFPVSFSTSVSIFSLAVFALLSHLSTGSQLGFLFKKTFSSAIIGKLRTFHTISHLQWCLLPLPNFPLSGDPLNQLSALGFLANPWLISWLMIFPSIWVFHIAGRVNIDSDHSPTGQSWFPVVWAQPEVWF